MIHRSMTANGDTSAHDMYQPGRRAKKAREKSPPADPRFQGGLNCSQEEKYEWMRQRQKEKRAKKAR
jgi:hypothetical protein